MNRKLKKQGPPQFSTSFVPRHDVKA